MLNKYKVVMNRVLEEIKNIKIIESNVYRNRYDFGNIGNVDNSVLTGRDFLYAGIKNELGASLLYKEDNKYYGFYNEEIITMKIEDYIKNDSLVFKCLPIVDCIKNTKGDIILLIHKPKEDLKPRTKEYTMLPKQKHFHFVNVKTGACSCRGYFYCNTCEHTTNLGVLVK